VASSGSQSSPRSSSTVKQSSVRASVSSAPSWSSSWAVGDDGKVRLLDEVSLSHARAGFTSAGSVAAACPSGEEKEEEDEVVTEDGEEEQEEKGDEEESRRCEPLDVERRSSGELDVDGEVAASEDCPSKRAASRGQRTRTMA
jgi:hypothetical protein